jgi:hypothetical protein
MNTRAEILCQQCGCKMKLRKIAKSDLGLQMLGLLLAIVGVAIAIFLFPVGILIFLLLLIPAGRMGYKKRKGWHCANCGYFFEAES